MSRYENSDYAVLLRKFFRLIIKDGRTTSHTPELIGSCGPRAACSCWTCIALSVVRQRISSEVSVAL